MAAAQGGVKGLRDEVTWGTRARSGQPCKSKMFAKRSN